MDAFVINGKKILRNQEEHTLKNSDFEKRSKEKMSKNWSHRLIFFPMVICRWHLYIICNNIPDKLISFWALYT